MTNWVFLLCYLQDVMRPETRIEKTTEIDGDLGAEEVKCSGLSTGVARIIGHPLYGYVGLSQDDF
jgi:hypothetical protein